MGGRRNLLWLAALVLGIGAAAYFSAEPKHQVGDQDDVGRQLLLPMPFDEVTAVEIVVRGQLYRFDRDAERVWYYHRHRQQSDEAAAHQHVIDAEAAGQIEQALSLFGRTRIESTVAVGESGAKYGLSNPEVMVMLYEGGAPLPTIRFLIGDLAPDELSRYLMIPDYATIVTIPDKQLTSLTDLVAAMTAGG